ncbi:glycoside hydrolase family 16 protein [Paenibacillus sp. D9]|uniref:glycoside hydrolase family 16 protein n=1 Tax=Paenibacillus sp. D9 TaxID=665792 RepID=UPI000676A3D5|nr:glycoside hydrolase family 16 protein [Paenibacillus sp. D9]
MSSTIKAAVNNHFVSADQAGASPLVANRAVAQNWEKFNVIHNSDNTVSFLSIANNKYVTADLNQGTKLIARASTIQAWEKFRKIDRGNGKTALQAVANNLYVSVDLNQGSILYANRTSASGWEEFIVSASDSAPAPAPDNWSLVWSDEFDGADGTAPDPSKWGYDIGGHGWGNKEKQYYTNSTKNAYQDGSGHLVIKAIKENINGMSYSSARLVSKNKGDWMYGKFVVRAKLPYGKGIWPAIWMLPTNYEYGGWPASGEIDIMEQRGSDPLKVMGTVHFGNPWKYIGSNYTLPDNGYHDYSVEWEPNQIRWYVDGKLYQTRNSNEWFSSGGSSPAPFNKKFHFLLNLAVGGDFDGDPDGSTIFPQTMMIDFVRVYSRNTVTK